MKVWLLGVVVCWDRSLMLASAHGWPPFKATLLAASNEALAESAKSALVPRECQMPGFGEERKVVCYFGLINSPSPPCQGGAHIIGVYRVSLKECAFVKAKPKCQISSLSPTPYPPLLN